MTSLVGVGSRVTDGLDFTFCVAMPGKMGGRSPPSHSNKLQVTQVFSNKLSVPTAFESLYENNKRRQ